MNMGYNKDELRDEYFKRMKRGKMDDIIDIQKREQQHQESLRQLKEAQENQQMEQIRQYFEQTLLSGGPSSLRVIAKIGGSSYDITITKQDELDMVQKLINKFINSFETKYPRPNKLF